MPGARILFLRHLKAEPGDAAAWEMLAQCEMEEDQDGSAVRCAGEAARLRPEWHQARLTLARALAGMGELVLASHELDAAEAAGRASLGPGFAGSPFLEQVTDERDRVRAALRGWMGSVRRALEARASGASKEEEEEAEDDEDGGAQVAGASSSSSAAGPGLRDPLADAWRGGVEGGDAATVSAAASRAAGRSEEALTSSSSASGAMAGGDAGRMHAPMACGCAPDPVDLPRPYPPLPAGPAAAAAAGPAPGLALTWDLPMSWEEVDADAKLRFTRAGVAAAPP